MAEKKVLVFSDLSGIIIRENTEIALCDEWREDILFLDGAIDAIREINQIPNSYFSIITNHPIVSKFGEEHRKIAEERIKGLGEYVMSMLQNCDARVHRYISSPYASDEFLKRINNTGLCVDPKYIFDNHPMTKPNHGLIDEITRSIGINGDGYKIFNIGNKECDMEMGIRAKATNIFISKDKDLLNHISKTYNKEIINNTPHTTTCIYDAARHIQDILKCEDKQGG